MSTHEVSQIEFVVSRADKHGATFAETGDRLAADVVVGHQTTAVGVALEGLVTQLAIELVHVDGHTEQLLILLKESYPGVDVAGAVVAVYHSHERTVGRGDQVDGLVGLRQGLLEHNHRERRSAGRDVARALLHGVRGHHAGAGVALGRTDGDASLQVSADVELLGTLRRQESGVLASVQ